MREAWKDSATDMGPQLRRTTVIVDLDLRHVARNLAQQIEQRFVV